MAKEQSGEELAVVALEREFMAALQHRDMAYLEAALGERFTLTTGRPGAEMCSGDEWLAITRDRYTIESFSFDWMHADVYGSAAVVRSRYSQQGAMDGEDRSTAYLMADVRIRTERRGQLVSRHITPLQSARGA